MKRSHSLNWLFLALCLLTLALLVYPAVTTSAEQSGLEAAWERAREAGSYRFIADVEQTLIPRPLPGMIGQTDERVDMRIEGDVTLPDQARMEFRFEGAGLNAAPITLVRDGAETYLLQGDERVPVENPAGLSSPTSDYLSYLAAAENVQPCPASPPELGGAGGGQPSPPELGGTEGGLICYSYDINGMRFAEHVRDQMEAQFAESEHPLPPGVELSPSPLLQRMSGHGELWVDADGLPLRQVIDLEMPEVNEEYDAQVRIIVDFRFDESARQRISVGLGDLGGLFGNLRGLEVSVNPTDLYCLLFSIAMASVLIAYHRRRWVYGLIAVSVSIIMVISPLLQVDGIVRFQERQAQAAPAETIADALGLSRSQFPIPNPQSPRLTQQSEPPFKCGDGSATEDSDGDGLSDADEYCLGTDPEHEDSDRDTITDTVEIDGFGCGGHHWTSNPFLPDSNHDGLFDFAEWPGPVGEAPHLDDVADDWDPDGDGVPNLWDEDNDGDSVPDSLDLSPFARAAYSDTFSLTTQGGDFDGYQYIELQVQPEDMSHLRYSTGYLDWPHDEKGQIQDLDDSTEDIRLSPMLRIRTNQPPDRDLAQDYNVVVFEEDDGYTLYAALSPIGDGGQMVAFYAKVAYGPDELADIRWEKVELVWTVQLSNDQEAGGKIVTSVTPIGIQAEESFRVTGLQITKSRNFESAILGTPETPAEDRWLFNLLFGLSNTFLTHQDPDLQEVGHRFSSPNTPIEETWGVPAQRVAVDLPDNPYGHSDEGFADLAGRVRNFFEEHDYPTDGNPSLVIAFQEEAGLYGLDDQGQFEPGPSFNLNLANVAMSTSRGLKSSTYHNEDGSWRPLDLQETLDVMEQRYEDDLSGILADLQQGGAYPDLTEDDLRGLLRMFYTSWTMGQTRIISMDGQALVPQGRDDQEVYDQLHNDDRDTLPAYLLEATDLGDPDGGLKIGDNQAQEWEYQRGQEEKGNEVGLVAFAGSFIGLDGDEFATWITRAEKAIWALQKIRGLLEVAKVVKKATRISKFYGRLGWALTYVDLALIWSGFVLTFWASGWDWDSPVVKASLASAIAWTIIIAVLIIIAYIPVLGTLFKILTLIDIIIYFSTGGEFTILSWIAKGLAGLFYDCKTLTELEDIDFVGFDTAVMDKDIGIVVGNHFRVSDEFVGTIKRTSDGEDDDLEDSRVTAAYHGSATGATAVNKNGRADCSISGRTKTCRDPVAVEYSLDTAKRNVKLEVESSVEAKTFYKDCWVGICDRESQYTDLPDDLPKYDQWEPMIFYLDVLPANFLDLWNWNEIINPDPDGDGLSNDEEASLGANSSNWDTDGDGLSDGFEFESQETLGADPLDADSDDDGLSDGLEYRIGTKINAPDSDDDGLTDGEEVFHQDAGGDWVGGWLVNLPTRTAWVFSDPLVADADGDRLNDRSERSQAVSPYGYNDTPRLTLEGDPVATSPDGATGVYVELGDTVAMTLTLNNKGPHPVTSTLTLCLPDFLTDMQYDANMSGDRNPSTQAAASCNGLQWSFALDELLSNESVNTTVTATVTTTLSSSASGEISATLPYRVGDDEGDIIDQVTVVADLDDPEVSITAPLSGTLLGGGISHYVIGGSASDESSWVTGVKVDLPAGVGTVDAEGISPWAYTWELPDDGEYTLHARSYDYLGRIDLSATVAVTVDNTAPTVTLNLQDGQVVSGTSSNVITITLAGDAGDNLSGLTRVQISTDGRPWREVWAEVGQTFLSANWSTEWTLPNEESAQGQHTVEVRAFDRAGNRSDALHRTIIVDVVPPTSELTDRTYLSDPPPHVPTDQKLDLYGVANDAGNVPLPSRPVELVGELDSIDDATIWLELSSVDDDDDGVSVAWLGDFNGDRLSDLVVGLPAAEGGVGRVTVLYGRAGGWPTPHDAELLANSPTSFVGKSGAGIGDTIAAAGDVNGDGFSDLLIGDSKNNRVYVVFGRPGPLGRDLALDSPRYPYWSELSAPDGEQIGTWLAAAGDVNGDGLDDLLIGATPSTGSSGRCYLLLGEANPWLETVPLDVKAAAEIATDPAGARLSGVGDMDGDHYDEFVVVDGATVYLFEGRDSFAAGTGEPDETLTLADDAIATFVSAETRPEVAALGDVNGDDLADFVYADGDTPNLVFGDVNRDWYTQALDFSPAASGFLVAPGDVDADGLNDILLGNADGDAYLVMGKDLSKVAATLTGVQAAASTLYAAGADLNSDGSSDLLLAPSELGGTMMRAVEYGPMPHVNPADLPIVEPGFFPKNRVSRALSPQAMRYVNDDGTCAGGTPCYADIQTAVDAASDGDTINVEPGVYVSFTVDSVNDLTISGVHADAVFVDGNDGDFAVKIQDADGVKLEDMTLRNADDALYLENAGVGGHEDAAKRIVLDTLLIYDFNQHAVKMDRDSTLKLTRCTLAGGDNHFEVYGVPDPAVDANWSTVLTDSRAATSERGGILTDGEEIYFIDDSAQIDVYDPDAATWSTLSAPPRGFNAGMTADAPAGDDHLWALRGDEFGGFDGPVYAIAYVDDNEIYVGGDFHHVGDVAVNYIARWDGSGWVTVGSGADSPDDVVYAIEIDDDHIYAGGTFGLRYLPDRTSASAWQDWGAITGGGAVYAIAPHGDDVYVGGSFTKIGGISAKRIAKWDFFDGWQLLGRNATSSCNGAMRGSHISALVIKGDRLYLGGQFATAAHYSGPNYSCSTGCTTNLARMRLSDDIFEHVTDCANMLDHDEDVYTIGFSGNDLVVGGDFSCVDYEWDAHSEWCEQDADNLAILKPGGSWQAPDYLQTNRAVRTLQVDGGSLYIGGDFTQVGGSTAVNRVAYYDNFPATGGAWHSLDNGVDDSVRALVRGGGNTYVGGEFTQAGGDAAFGLARWDGSRWTSQAFYEYDGSWQARSDPSVLLGEGSTIASDGDGILYAVPGGDSSDFYRYTISSDTWAKRASLPGGVGAGAALVWAGDYLYTLRGGGHSDFYRYSPAGNTWDTLEPVTNTIDAGGAMAWDGRNWLYVLAGGNGRQLLRYRIPDSKWEVQDNTPSQVNAGGGLARIGQNLYGVRGCGVASCGEELWSYDPIAVYPEKLTLDHVAIVAPEAAPAADWINLGSVVIPPDDFVVGGSDSTWVGGEGVTWSPDPQLDGSAQITHDEARFLDTDHDVYRLDSGSLLDGGYHTYRPEAVVGDGEEFTNIQAAIDSGANRVQLRPGTFQETFYLMSGVEVVGNGADLTIVEPPAGNTDPAIVRAEGVVGAELSMLTLHGDDSGVDGLLVEDGTQSATLGRTIIRGANTGISTTGGDTELEVVNNTVVSNTNGMVAANCAPVDVRNTIFAYHTGAGLTYDGCATRQLHKYNLYRYNGTDLSPSNPKPGELFLDPLFVDPPSHDYHTKDASPVIDAGDPGDPPPPGGGGRVDIGYIEQNRAALYVDDDYCATCVNDGLSWQVDAFKHIQNALDKAADNIHDLKGLRYTIGVGAGTYTETITIASHVRLVGSGAEETTIDADGSGVPVTFDSAVQAEITGFTIEGCPDTAAISVTGASNAITVTRNIIDGCDVGVGFSGRASGLVTFNTIVNSEKTIVSSGPGSWATVENNILYDPHFCEGGLWVEDSGQVFTDYNLRESEQEIEVCFNVDKGPNDLCGEIPDFAPGSYRIQADSPARDAASPYAEVPPGGGERADMGYYELTAEPVTLFLGREDVSSATGNSGMDAVEVGFSQINDPADPVTDTVPTAWITVTLDTPEETVSYWQTAFTPTEESLYRFYSRGTDVAGNQECSGESTCSPWYDGAFVADSVTPVVTWTQPANGAVISTPLELRAQVYDYAAGAFSVEDIYFVVDGNEIQAEWAADPWDEENEEPRTFRAWVNLSTNTTYNNAAAFAEDRAGNVMSDTVSFSVSGSSGADSTPPALAVISPTEGSWYTSTVVFSGTVTDIGGSGVAAVEVSLDGGYTWLPATVDAGFTPARWNLTWEAPEDQEFVSYPAWVRARDQAGNSTQQARTFSIDNVPPVGPHVEEFTAIIGLFEKEAPPGTHFDTPVSLRTTWRQPVDGSGVATTLISVDQVSDTLPTTNLGTATSYTYPLSLPDDWYVHLAVEDIVGNQFVRHYGPWHVGTFASAINFADRVQTIVVDGQIDTDLATEEWRRIGREWGIYEFMDDFEPPMHIGALTPQAALDWWGRQRMFAAWDGANVYLGWMGAWWTLDGTLWAYLGTQDGGCEDPVVPMSDTLPFDAEYAIEITSPTSGTLWACTGSAWQKDTGTDWEFAQGDGGDTEIRLALDTPSIIDLQLIAFALDDDGQPWSVFPTTNPLFGDWADEYLWHPGTTITPTLGQPVGTSVLMALDSLQAPQAAWCANSDLQYVTELRNQELYTVAGLQLVFDVSPGLDYQGVEGAILSGDWQFDLPELPPGVSHPITITGKLASDVCNLIGSTSVSVSVSLPIISSLAQLDLSHRLDCEPPTVTVATDPAQTIRPVYGSATDGGGSGVALVEYQVNDGEWRTTTGTLFWAADIELPAATTWQLHVRAWDQCGQTSGVTTVDFSDSIPPTVTLDTHYLEWLADLAGAASDLPTGGEVVVVEVRIDDETAAWQPASVGAPGADGVQNWQFTWGSPWDGITHTVWIRAADVAGNVGQSGPFEVYAAEGEPVGGYTEQIGPPALLWLWIALVVALAGTAVIATLKKRTSGH